MHHPAGWSIRAHEQRDPGIPLRGYFLCVGGALLALLLAANALLPSPPSNGRIGSEANLPNIRIHSELKGPEAVVIDTTRPVPTQAPAARMDIAGPQTVGLAGEATQRADAPRESEQYAALAPAELRASFAELVTAPPKQAASGEAKRPKASPPGRRRQ